MKSKPCAGSVDTLTVPIHANKRWAWLLLLVLVVVGCSTDSNPVSLPAPTDTPVRPNQREVINTGNPEGFLKVTLSELNILAEEDDPDTQILAILTDGDDASSVLVYPSNQPGVPETSLELSEYPLQIAPQAEQVALWIVAVKHQAYPISEAIGQEQIVDALTDALKDQIPNVSTPRLAELVAARGEQLLAWFGEIEVLGEVGINLRAVENWSSGENQIVSLDGGIQVQYAVTTNVTSNVPSTLPPQVDSISAPTPMPSIFDEPIAGYDLVVDDDFAEARSIVNWFIGSDPTYSASIVNGAYQITLIETDERRGGIALSWGSIQDLVFDNYIVRARVRLLQDDITARYGLWVHYIDDLNFLFFGVESTGRYRVARFQRGYTELAPWTVDRDSIINRGANTNEFEIAMQEDIYTMAINGQNVVTTTDGIFKEGRIAFFCYAESVPTTCHLERLQVWLPSGSPFPVPTDTPIPES